VLRRGVRVLCEGSYSCCAGPSGWYCSASGCTSAEAVGPTQASEDFIEMFAGLKGEDGKVNDTCCGAGCEFYCEGNYSCCAGPSGWYCSAGGCTSEVRRHQTIHPDPST
jgi:hypothetical protein